MRKRKGKKKSKLTLFHVGTIILIIGALMVGTTAVPALLEVTGDEWLETSAGSSVTIHGSAIYHDTGQQYSWIPDEPYSMWIYKNSNAAWDDELVNPSVMYDEEVSFSWVYPVPSEEYISEHWAMEWRGDTYYFYNDIWTKVVMRTPGAESSGWTIGTLTTRIAVPTTYTTPSVEGAEVTLSAYIDGNPIGCGKISMTIAGNTYWIGDSNKVSLPATFGVAAGHLPGTVTFCITDTSGGTFEPASGCTGCRSFELSYGDVVTLTDGGITLTCPSPPTPATTTTTATTAVTTNGVTTTTTATTTAVDVTVTQDIYTGTVYTTITATESPTTETTATSYAPSADMPLLFPGVFMLAVGGGMMAYSKKR